MKIVKKTEVFQNALTRRVEKILPAKEGLVKLIEKRKIRLYQGFDPTGYRLHVGHTIGLRKLMEFADLGHEVIFLFGTGTVLVGDPSQRDTRRKLITQEEIEQNIKDWKKQVEPIVNFEKVTIKRNGEWLTKLTLKDIINIASKISAVQLFKREMFQRRIKHGDTVWYHETMYPILQGYDSVVMDVDLEIGGTDQEFNMLIGRELQKKFRNKEKYVLTVPMIMGTDGKPMSKTSGNCVWLDGPPEDMYGKLMSVPDEQIIQYMELLTDIPFQEIKSLPEKPLQNKKRVALEVTAQFHGAQNALKAQKHFEKTVQKGELPAKIREFPIEPGTYTSLVTVSAALPDVSRSEIKRVIRQGGVEWRGRRVTDPNQTLTVKGGEVLQFGKRVFRKAAVKTRQ
ncbi:tyrosine--tRNA ligase [Patescibacteria group bacterium]|nr:tyrosine--tRNA ligase [Patescibacteria group bacterium]